MAPQILFDRVMDIPVDTRVWCTQCELFRKPWNPRWSTSLRSCSCSSSSFSYMNVKVPQIQFTVRVLTSCCATETDTHSANCADNRGDSTGALRLLGCFCDHAASVPQFHSYLNVKMPPIQFVVRVRTFLQCNRDWYSQCKRAKFREIPQVQSCGRRRKVDVVVPQIQSSLFLWRWEGDFWRL